MNVGFSIDTSEIGELHHYLVLDYLEILLLSGEYDEISKSDFDDILRDQGVYDKNSIPHLPWIRHDPRFKADGDVHELYIAIVWECLAKRLSMLGDATPYVLEENVLRLDEERSRSCSDYILLLLCSKLRMLKKAKQIELATRFEKLCVKYMRKKLFAGAEIRRFAKGGDFSTQLTEAIQQLAEWLREPVRQSALTELTDQGDLGLDIVGKLNSDKHASGTLFLVGQCAAREKEWEKKRYEAKVILGVIDSFCAPLTLFFIPHAYRSADGRWVKEVFARDVALIDRVRLLAS